MIRELIHSSLDRTWYGGHEPGWFLRSLEQVYARGVSQARQRGLARRDPALAGRAIVVVGNLVAGGSGKTPLVVRLCEMLESAGLTLAVVSRGYGRRGRGQVTLDEDCNARESGDEPLLIQRRTGTLVIVNADREAACRAAFAAGAQVVIADDGLQRASLPRAIEVCVVDAQRGLGNGHLLPAGPLREPAERLASVDFLVSNGGPWAPDTASNPVPSLTIETPSAHVMSLAPGSFRSMQDGRVLAPEQMREWLGERAVHAVAGIGNPERFFSLLRELGIRLAHCHSFPDHHRFRQRDFRGIEGPVLMTEKDQVKCAALRIPDGWYLPVRAVLPAAFEAAFLGRIRSMLEASPC